MDIYSILEKKKRGNELNRDEIFYFVNSYVSGEIKDYQASALLMAICINEMTEQETIYLCEAMYKSGDLIDLSSVDGLCADKHSTGGVGDKTTLIVAPIMASFGIHMAKMSGKGLGHTGGTIDKLEAIKGLNTKLDSDEFFKCVNENFIAVASQTKNLVPADKLIYALRDATATVDNVSLIASSIMSKKIASGADVLVLDVKLGSGAFMKDYDSAAKLSKLMVSLGEEHKIRTTAIITNMDQPLGFSIGNYLEVYEAIDVLSMKGPEDTLKISVELASSILVMAGKFKTRKEAGEAVIEKLKSGKPLEYFYKFIEGQGGTIEQGLSSKYSLDVLSEKEGYISKIDAETFGHASTDLGAGRHSKEDELDYLSGIILHKKLGNKVKVGDVLYTLYTEHEDKFETAKNRLKNAIEISETKVDSEKYIYGVVYKDNNEICEERY